MIKISATVLGVVALAAAFIYWNICPCAVVPGGPLGGEVVESPVGDWSFVNDAEAVPLCQIEVAFALPRSMNVNCMSVDQRLYVSCSQCAGKQWSAQALKQPRGNVRAAGKVYPITYQRVNAGPDLDRIWRARLEKIGAEPAPRPDHWWSFQLAQGQP